MASTGWAQPSWGKTANWSAIGIGIVGYVACMALGWPWWTRWMPLLGALALVWLAEWIWARRQDREVE